MDRTEGFDDYYPCGNKLDCELTSLLIEPACQRKTLSI